MEGKERLVGILERLNSGEDPEDVKMEASEFLASIGPKELAEAEQALIDGGMRKEDIQRLCPLHMDVLSKGPDLRKRLEPGHVIHTMTSEHEMILGFLDTLESIAMKSREGPLGGKELGKLLHVAEHLVGAESHHEREEKVLFPKLEALGISGPPHIMRMEHDEMRGKKKELLGISRKAVAGEMGQEELNERLGEVAGHIVVQLRDHIFKEDNILYPAALESMEGSEWEGMRKECDRLGYCCFTPGHSC